MTELVLLAKHWRPGLAKTRLAATIGHERASRVHQAFVETTMRRFAGVAACRSVAVAPDDACDDFAVVAGQDWLARSQGPGDLGARLARHFQQAWSRGARRVVAIGSDSPSLPIGYVEQAFDLLETAPVVLGPAEDGGYYLLGLRAGDEAGAPPIFDDMPWSTSRVWEETAARLAGAGIAFRGLPPWYDVDTEADLRRLCDELRTATEPELVRLAGRITNILDSD